MKTLALLLTTVLLSACSTEDRPLCNDADMDDFGLDFDCLKDPTCHLDRNQIKTFAYAAAVCSDDPLIIGRLQQHLPREVRSVP